MELRRFRKRPIEVEAIRYDGRNGWGIERWSEGKIRESPVLEPSPDNPSGAYLQVNSSSSCCEVAGVGDWVVREGGALKAYTDEAFQRSYEPVLPDKIEAQRLEVGLMELPENPTIQFTDESRKSLQGALMGWMTRGNMRHESKPDPRVPTPNDVPTEVLCRDCGFPRRSPTCRKGCP